MPLIDNERVENQSAGLVVAALGGLRSERRDTRNLGHQIRDFDIIFADHCEPLEITISADQVVLNSMARMEGNQRVEAVVKRVWFVMVPRATTGAGGILTPFDRTTCVGLLVPFVERLERNGQEEFDTSMYAHVPGPYQQEARGLLVIGVRVGGSYEPSEPDDEPGIVIHLSHGGIVETEAITEAIENAAGDDGNQAKLAACIEAPRRHLFVVITSASEDLAYPALLDVMSGERDPPRRPSLPNAVTTAWAGTGFGGIYVTPPGDWQRFGAMEVG